MTFAGKLMELEIIMLCEISQTQNESCIFFYIKNLNNIICAHIYVCMYLYVCVCLTAFRSVGFKKKKKKGQ